MGKEEILFYMKIHTRGKTSVVGVCDKDCLDKTYREGKFRFKVTRQFFEGELVTKEIVLDVLRKSTNFNIVGEEICSLLINEKIIHEDGIRRIQGIPIAIKFVI